jgi:hypothetical protein
MKDRILRQTASVDQIDNPEVVKMVRASQLLSSDMEGLSGKSAAATLMNTDTAHKEALAKGIKDANSAEKRTLALNKARSSSRFENDRLVRQAKQGARELNQIITRKRQSMPSLFQAWNTMDKTIKGWKSNKRRLTAATRNAITMAYMAQFDAGQPHNFVTEV